MINYIIAITIIVLFGFYLYYENNFLKVTKIYLLSKKIPKDFSGFKIAHISDFHNTRSKKVKKDLIKCLTEEKPDIIIVTGDMIDSRRTDINISIRFIKDIIRIAPIYYVNGNHESRLKEYNIFKDEIIKLGVNVLENDSKILRRNESIIEILGVNDPSFKVKKVADNKDVLKEEIESLFHNNYYKILLSHRPEHFKLYVKEKLDLVFTGHAHGGQIRLPFVGGVFAPNQGYFPKYTSGVHEQDKTKMVISRGVGPSQFPFRINNRPEIIVASLKLYTG